MTQNQTAVSVEQELDSILFLLFYVKISSSIAEQQNSGYTIASLCEILEFSKETQHVNYLAELLASDGVIEPLNPRFPLLFRISPVGVSFILQGGYVQDLENKKKQEEAERLEIRLKKTSISSNLWNRAAVIFGFAISITSLVLSIIALNKD